MSNRSVAEAETRDLAVVDKAANGYDLVKTKTVTTADGDKIKTITTTETSHEFSWQAAAWRLERRPPSRWGRNDHMEVMNPGERREKESLKRSISTPPRTWPSC